MFIKIGVYCSRLFTVFSRLNAGSVYLKLGLVDPAFIRTRRLFGARHLLNAFFSIGGLLNQQPNSKKTFKKCETMSSPLSHLNPSLAETVIEHFSTLRFSAHETRRKCIGNCSTANVLCKQFRTRWWGGSYSISSEKSKIMARVNCKVLLEKRWRDPRDDPCLMYKPAEELPWLKRDWHDTWCVVCFICFSKWDVLL